MSDMVQGGNGASIGVTPTVGGQAGILRCTCGQPAAPRGRFCSRRCKDQAYNLAHPVVRQSSLPLDPEPKRLIPTHDQRLTLAEEGKLRGDNALVMRRLRQGPATTRELQAAAPESMAIHSRVSDVRRELERNGETVTRRQLGPRLHLYTIERWP